MSMFSIPDGLRPDTTMLDDVMKQTKALMPAEFAGSVNLMAHPLAGAAAMTALGVGFASQAVGIWFGAITGATAASQRLFLPMFDEIGGSADTFRDTARTPQIRAETATASLLAEAGAAIEAPVSRPKKSKATKASPDESTQAPEAAVEPAAAEVANSQAEPPAPTAEAAFAVEAPVEIAAEAPVEQAVEQQPAAVPAATEAAPAAVALAPEDFRKPAAMDKPEQPDDLKAISGIGPKLEQVLNGLGVWTYAQIAGWGRAEIAWVDDTLGFKGRIERDDWLGQAAKLAAQARA